jgi:hypothetical protein
MAAVGLSPARNAAGARIKWMLAIDKARAPLDHGRTGAAFRARVRIGGLRGEMRNKIDGKALRTLSFPAASSSFPA